MTVKTRNEIADEHKMVRNPEFSEEAQHDWWSYANSTNFPYQSELGMARSLRGSRWICSACNWRSVEQETGANTPTKAVLRAFGLHIRAHCAMQPGWNPDPVFAGGIYPTRGDHVREFWIYDLSGGFQQASVRFAADGVPGNTSWSWFKVADHRARSVNTTRHTTFEGALTWVFAELHKASEEGRRIMLSDEWKGKEAPLLHLPDAVKQFAANALDVSTVKEAHATLVELNELLAIADTLKEVKATLTTRAFSVD